MTNSLVDWNTETKLRGPQGKRSRALEPCGLPGGLLRTLEIDQTDFTRNIKAKNAKAWDSQRLTSQKVTRASKCDCPFASRPGPSLQAAMFNPRTYL